MKSDSANLVFPEFSFSHGMFTVFDDAVGLPEVDFSDTHVAQGFARNDSAVWLFTPEEYGGACLRVATGPFRSDEEYDRVVAVPFHCVSGKVTIMEPECLSEDGNKIEIPPGHYRLTVAQRVTQEEDDDHEAEEQIDLFFEPLAEPASRSEILIADEMMDPPAVLQEDGGIVGK